MSAKSRSRRRISAPSGGVGVVMSARRDFLKALGGASALAAPFATSVATLAGCATMAPSSGKVVVVGGGYGGATAAKYIRMWSNGRVDVTLVEPNLDFISCPMSNLVLGGSRTLGRPAPKPQPIAQFLG